MLDELKKNEDEGNGDGDGADNAGAGNGDGNEDTITIKKAEFEQIKADRDNYRTGLLNKKADERKLDDKGNSGADNKGNATATIDEAKIIEIAKAHSSAAINEIYNANESRAKRAILQKYGELVDDARWADFISDFRSKRGKTTPEDILDDFEDTMLLYKRRTGKLDEHLQAERERGVREGRIQSELGSGHGGGTGDKNDAGKFSGLSEKGKEMARAMHTDPEKAAKADYSKDNVIDVLGYKK